MVPGFYRWATPHITARVAKPGALEGTKDVVLTIAQGAKTWDFHKDELEIDEAAGTVGVTLTQAVTGELEAATVEVQLNILYDNGNRDPTCKGCINIFENLLDEELV